MRAHGDAVVGAGLEQAILRTIQLAFLGELAHMAVAHGEPLYMTPEELATFSADQSFPARPGNITQAGRGSAASLDSLITD